MTAREVADALVDSLLLPGWFYVEYARTGSCYLRCKDPRVGSIRVSDHEGRYPYRYNVRVDIGAHEKRRRLGDPRLFYGYQELDILARDVRREFNRRAFKPLDRMREAQRLADYQTWASRPRPPHPST